jgi:hypothetical protein
MSAVGSTKTLKIIPIQNIMNKSILKQCGAAAAILGLAVAVKADTTSYTDTVSGTFDFPSTALALQQFDPSLGTLNSISISLSAASFTSLTVSNSSPSAYGDPSSVWNDVEILLGNSTFDQAVDALNPNYGSFALPDAWLDVTSPHFSVANLASGDTESFSHANTAASGDPVVTSDITSGTIFSALQGTGIMNLDVYSVSTVDSGIEYGATFSATENVTGSMTATVTYNYTAPTPEPSTLAVCGIGLFGLFMTMRRRIA